MIKQVYVPDLPVFQAINQAVQNSAKPKLDDIAFICTQHELATTINLFESLIALGAKPENIYLMGKHYSTCLAVADKLTKLGIYRQPSSSQEEIGDFATTFKADIARMWRKFSEQCTHKKLRGIIILDDGGRCLAAAPEVLYAKFPIVGIEQTTGGVINPDTFHLPYPVIEVASSAAKLWLESPIIAAAAITERLDQILRSREKKPLCGVIGTGYIGMAVIKKLISLGYSVIGYDKNHSKACEFDDFAWGNNIEDVIGKAKYIFGCTGYDITPSLDFDELIKNNKVFFSCSSEDREFQTLLRLVKKQNSIYRPNKLENIHFRTAKGHIIEIFRAGFPITFDGGPQPAPANDIQLTQGLLLCALIQAATLLPPLAEQNRKGRLMLDPHIQQFVSGVWRQTQPSGRYADDFLNRFKDLQWIIDHSGGRYYALSYIINCFAKAECCQRLDGSQLLKSLNLVENNFRVFNKGLVEHFE